MTDRLSPTAMTDAEQHVLKVLRNLPSLPAAIVPGQLATPQLSAQQISRGLTLLRQRGAIVVAKFDQNKASTWMIISVSDAPECTARPERKPYSMTTDTAYYDRRYALMQQAVATAPKGRLVDVAMDLMGLQTSAAVARCRRKLESLGYDLADWHHAARAGTRAGLSLRKSCPPPPRHNTSPALRPAAEAPDHVLRRRTEWLADMRDVANEPGAIEQLCDRWQCSRDVVYGRIGALRNAGHDLSWWTPAPSRGFGDADAITAAASEVKPLPVVEIQAHASRYAAPVPWTMQAVAEIAGVPYMRARFVARAHGIPFTVTTLDEATALGLLSALGFTPRREVAA